MKKARHKQPKKDKPRFQHLDVDFSRLWAPPVPGAASFACSPQELIAKFETDAAYEARYREWIGSAEPTTADDKKVKPD